MAFGVTEPDAGTDTSRITTRADEDGHGGFVVHGRKIWTTKALESEVVLLLVRTDPGVKNRFDGLTLFLADLDPRYVDIRPIPKVGRNAVASCEVAYDGLPVEGWRMVGERGRGFQHILHGLNPERILLAAMTCGIGEAALRRAVHYAGEREVFGRLIGANQSISHPLAKAHMELRAAWQMMSLAAWRYDHGLECGEEANTAKYLAAEAAYFAADQAIQTHGGLGYASEYHVERYWREARLQRLAPGEPGDDPATSSPSRCSACPAATDHYVVPRDGTHGESRSRHGRVPRHRCGHGARSSPTAGARGLGGGAHDERRRRRGRAEVGGRAFTVDLARCRPGRRADPRVEADGRPRRRAREQRRAREPQLVPRRGRATHP